MKTIEINLKNIKKTDTSLIVDYFLKGKTVAYPTDTVYGLGCIATNTSAINKVYKIKKRKKDLPFIILVKSFCMAKKYAKISKKQEIFLKTVWPSRKSSDIQNKNAIKTPKTIILDSSGALPKIAVAPNNSIALRLPKNDFLSTILKKIDLPLISTSLNLSGKKIINNPSEVKKYFKDLQPDLLVSVGIISDKKTSSIIDIREIENIKKIR